MKTETKCHAFWKTNRNPITMKKCADEKGLHIRNQSKEQVIALADWRQRKIDRRDNFNFNNQ